MRFDDDIGEWLPERPPDVPEFESQPEPKPAIPESASTFLSPPYDIARHGLGGIQWHLEELENDLGAFSQGCAPGRQRGRQDDFQERDAPGRFHDDCPDPF